jgi:hypothetical protein
MDTTAFTEASNTYLPSVDKMAAIHDTAGPIKIGGQWLLGYLNV